MQLQRDELFADRNLVGTVFCRAYARRVDEWLQELFEEETGGAAGLSLVAIGGYGRSDLCPQSDLDLMLLHAGWREDQLVDLAQRLWYPVWDAGLMLGHSVRTIKQSIELAKTDLETATSLLTLRHLAGDAELSNDLAEQSMREWRQKPKRWLPSIVDGAAEREVESGEVAFLLEPDLKYSSGGLRDVHAVQWVEAAGIDLLSQERRDLHRASDVLLAARVELHRSTGRRGDRLLLEEQDPVADALGIGDADVMMSQIAASARTINWIAEGVFSRVGNRLRRFHQLRSRKQRNVAEDIVLAEGVVGLAAGAPIADDPALLLRLSVAAAESDARIDRDALDALVDSGPAIPTPWPRHIRTLFVQLLLNGHTAIPVIETLDHVGLFTRLLPEWEPTRSKVQRNQYHRFTVDRHLLEACANAAELVERVDRPDLLVVGALLHDIGKGYPGDHTDVGVEKIDVIAPNMGFDAEDVDTLKRLCRHHLLLPDAATRRDIEDVGTIRSVAEQVETSSFLHLLGALTEADSIATGPSAWSSWKAHLITELSRSVDRWLSTDGEMQAERVFPGDQLLARLQNEEHVVEGLDDTLTVITPDRTGLFASVAGAIALKNLSILWAQSYTEDGKALEVMRVVDSVDEFAEIDWPEIVGLVEEVLAGNVDLPQRFAEREAAMIVRPTVAPVPIEPVRVDFDNEISAFSTVLEVSGPDRIGLLYELLAALASQEIDVQQTMVQTVGGDVVDSFYVQLPDGSKIVDEPAQNNLRNELIAILSED